MLFFLFIRWVSSNDYNLDSIKVSPPKNERLQTMGEGVAKGPKALLVRANMQNIEP